jgi:hypothetical protein
MTSPDHALPYELKHVHTYTSHISSSAFPFLLSRMNSAGSDGNVGTDAGNQQPLIAAPTTVAQALELARESPEGEQDPTVKEILEAALREVWGKITAQPTSYVMTRDEFAVFNYFQQRFDGQNLAAEAKRRYWDRYTLGNGT